MEGIRSSVFKRSPRLKNAKLKDGSLKAYQLPGGWFYRLRYVDQDGRPCTEDRGPFLRKADAKDAMNLASADARVTGGRSRRGQGKTFADLAVICEREIFHAARYVSNAAGNQERTSGIKSWKTVKSQVARLKRFFGSRLVTSITTKSLRDYKESRRNEFRKTKPGDTPRPISQTTVNRELATMRRMMRYAQLELGWTTGDIFAGARVIETSKEVPRQRILSPREEEALLAACQGEWEREYSRTIAGQQRKVKAKFTIDNWHLRALIILALETGMRRGEMLKMRWQDVDLGMGFIRVVGTHTKTERERIVPLSQRAREVIESLPGDRSARPFPMSDIKRSFATVKRLAGVDDLRFHDLRATAGDRMSKVFPLSTVAKILGHSQLQTTMRHYIGNEIDTVLEVKGWLDQSRSQVSAITHELDSEAIN